MKAYIIEGGPAKINPILTELCQIGGIIIHKINETYDSIPGMGKYISSRQVIFFAMDEEVATYLTLKFPNVIHPCNA